MPITELNVSSAGGPLSVRVGDPNRPHGVVAVVWAFQSDNTLEGKVGELTEGSALPLGAPTSLDGKALVIDGFVVPFMSEPEEPYEVVVSVLQGGAVIHRIVPPDHGSGKIGKDAQRFRYPFKVRAAA
jgi:hypothetical protein